MSRRRLPLHERYVVDKTTGCWRFTGYIDPNGYGRCYDPETGGRIGAHRLFYRELVGPIPEDMTIDHVWAWGCRYRDCVNPSHMQLVTLSENVARGEKARRWACRKGHRYTPENTYWAWDNRAKTRYRVCKTCRRWARLRHQEKVAG